jgi:hypothetical protein
MYHIIIIPCFRRRLREQKHLLNTLFVHTRDEWSGEAMELCNFNRLPSIVSEAGHVPCMRDTHTYRILVEKQNLLESGHLDAWDVRITLIWIKWEQNVRWMELVSVCFGIGCVELSLSVTRELLNCNKNFLGLSCTKLEERIEKKEWHPQPWWTNSY